jgi:DASS family divalent anion:Na+ symporter
LISFVLTPLLLYWLIRPEMKRTAQAKEMGEKAMVEMGPMTVKRARAHLLQPGIL